MIQRIGSTQNRYIKWLKSLKEKKYRDEIGKYILEGEKMSREALGMGALDALIIEDGLFPELVAEAEEQKMPVYIVSKHVLQSVSDAKTPQGVISVLPIPNRKWDPVEINGNIVVLENVQDPGNVGTIIRSAEAAGFAGVLLCGHCADPFSPKVARSAMGSLLRVPVYVDCSMNHIQTLKEKGYTICAGDLRGDDPLRKVDHLVLLVGSEASGLSEEALAIANMRFRLPMKGQVESLNAAVFASVAMYAIAGFSLTE